MQNYGATRIAKEQNDFIFRYKVPQHHITEGTELYSGFAFEGKLKSIFRQCDGEICILENEVHAVFNIGSQINSETNYQPTIHDIVGAFFQADKNYNVFLDTENNEIILDLETPYVTTAIL